ncbi:MAG: inositol monophosphatase [Anaerolineae bacterium]|nr:inositol monophosphatase [Anaerolineae bacterium]
MPCLVSDLLGSAEVVAQITTWVRQAGLMGLRYFNNVTPQIKPDQTLVTQADLEIEQFLRERLQTAFPTHQVRGEEESWPQTSQTADTIWVLDPIDGTTAFVQGLPGWGISVGLLHRGQPCFGAFYMPLLDDLTYTAIQGEVYCNKRRLRQSVRQDWGVKGFLAINASAHYDFQIGVRRTRAMGSIGASFVYTARGAAVGAFIPKAYVWDLVAGAAILSRTGGELRYLSGQSVDYLGLLDGRLTSEPLLAAHPDLQAELRHGIQPGHLS